VSLPTTRHALAAYYVILPAEASSNLARYDGVKFGLRVPARDLVEMESRTRAAGFGAEVKRRIMLGTYALSAGYYDAYYGKAQSVRTLVRREFAAAFARVDLIVAPTTPNVAFKLGEKEDPLSMYLNDVFHDPGQPGRYHGGLRAVRVSACRGCRSDYKSSAARSTRRACCARRTPTSRPRPGAGADRSCHERAVRYESSSGSRCTPSS